MVGTSTFIAIGFSLLLAVGVPIVLFVIFNKKYNISFKVVLFGILTFFVFAQVLEGTVHAFFLMINETTKTMLENPWLFMLYGGLMAGLFEETGRYIMMRYTLKNHRQWRDGLAFGLGHGGIEAILLVGVNSVMMLVIGTMINNGTYDALPVQTIEAMVPIKEQLTSNSALLIAAGGIERLSALAIQLGLSVFVLYAVKNGRLLYLLYAIFIHAVIDFPAALYQAGVIKNIWVIEAYIFAVGIASIYWIAKSRNIFLSDSL